MQSQKAPKISIVCRTYNHANVVRAAIDSVLAQTFQDWELIVSDDGSTDGTIDVLNTYTDYRIKILTNTNNIGIISNLNKVIAHARGEYISILDGDDVYFPDKLEKQASFLDKNPNYGAVFSYIECIGGTSKQQQSTHSLINTPSSNREGMLLKFFIEGNYLAFPTEMFRRKYVIEFPENMIAMGDCCFHIRTLLQSQIKVFETPLVKYRLSNNGSQTSSWATATSNRVENMMVLDKFLECTDVRFFKRIFKGYYEQFGNPEKKSIPYFLCRIAMTIPQNSFWGYYTLSKLFVDKSYFDYICKTYNLNYRDYIKIKMGDRASTYKVKFRGLTLLKVKLKKGIHKSTKRYMLLGIIPIWKKAIANT